MATAFKRKYQLCGSRKINELTYSLSYGFHNFNLQVSTIMTPNLLNFLCEPISKAPLRLINEITNSDGTIQSGALVSPSGACYPIINGIPRFVSYVPTDSVVSFGDEWNFFNFTDFKINWLKHTVANTFGSTDAFKGKLIVDAGGVVVRRPNGSLNMVPAT